MKIEWTRIKNDINGNGRYVCHFLNLNTQAEKAADYDTLTTSQKYEIAVKRANRIGGRKYHTKAYGGGIVFQSSSLPETEAAIERVLGEKL
jgi:hypothetical protein